MDRSEAWKMVIEKGSDAARINFKLLNSDYKNSIHPAYRYVCLDLIATEVFPKVMKRRGGKALHVSLVKFLYEIFWGKRLPSNRLVYLAAEDDILWEQNESVIKEKNLFHVFRDSYVEDWIEYLLDLEKLIPKNRIGNYDGGDGVATSSTIRKSCTTWKLELGENIEYFCDNLIFLREKAFANAQKKLWLKSGINVQNYLEIDELIDKEQGYFENIYFSKSKRNQEAIEKTFIKYFDDEYARMWLPIRRPYHFGTLQMRQQQLLMVGMPLSENRNIILAVDLATHKVICWYEAVTQYAALAEVTNSLSASAESKNTYIIFFLAVDEVENRTEQFLNHWNAKNTTRVADVIIRHLLINQYQPKFTYAREVEETVIMHTELYPIIQFLPTEHGIKSRALSEEIKAFFFGNMPQHIESNSLDIEQLIVSWNQASF